MNSCFTVYFKVSPVGRVPPGRVVRQGETDWMATPVQRGQKENPDWPGAGDVVGMRVNLVETGPMDSRDGGGSPAPGALEELKALRENLEIQVLQEKGVSRAKMVW